MEVSMPVNLWCNKELRITQGAIVKAKASAKNMAPLRCFKMNHAHKIANPTKGRMTERVRAVKPRKKPERRKKGVTGFSMEERRKKKEVRRRMKNGFSVPRPSG